MTERTEYELFNSLKSLFNYQPFSVEDAEYLINKVIIKDGIDYTITGVVDWGVELDDNIFNDTLTYDNLLYNMWRFEDGKLCGKYTQ